MSFGRTIGSSFRSSGANAILAALVAIVLAGSASAAEITYSSVVGSWRDPVDDTPGSQPRGSRHHERQPDVDHQVGRALQPHQLAERL